jgi:hypothetical protein
VRQREKGKIARQQKILIEPKETSCWYQALLVSLLYERKESSQAGKNSPSRSLLVSKETNCWYQALLV